MPYSAGTCRYMPYGAGICRYMPYGAGTCNKVLVHVIRCWYMTYGVELCYTMECLADTHDTQTYSRVDTWGPFSRSRIRCKFSNLF